MDVVVIGAGLAGLTAARALRRAGCDVHVLEAAAQVGGRVRSRVVRGSTLDHGFQVLFTAYPAVRRHLDLERLDLRTFPPAAVLVHADGRRERLGDPVRDPASLLDTLRAPSLALADKLRVARLVAHVAFLPELRPMPAHTRLVGPTVTARTYLQDLGFSTRAIESFFSPFFGGIFLDRSLGVDAGLFRYYLRMLVQGRTAIPAAGMQAIPDQLAAGVDVRLHTRVDALDADGRGVTVRGSWGELRAAAAVVATDPPELARLAGADAPTRGVGATYLHYRSPELIDDESRILLSPGPGPIADATWMTNVAPEYAPNGGALLSVTVLAGFDTDEALDRTVRDQLATWYGSGAARALERLAIDRIPFAQFAQPPGYAASLARPTTGKPNVVLASEATRFSSIQGAMESGEQAAATLLGDETVLARPRGA